MNTETIRLDPHVTYIRPVRGWLDVDFRELWEYRELLYFLVWRDIKVRYKQTIIGAGWAIAQPLLTMLAFTLFFGRLAKIPSDGLPYPIFYYAALVPWMYFANAVNGATNSIVEHRGVITKVYFPRLFLPLAAVISGLLDFGIAFTLLIGMTVFYGIVPSPPVLLLPLFVLFAIVTAFAVSLWLSALNARYRDVRYAVPFLIQFWMFASPVAYPASLVPEQWRTAYALNPVAGVIEGFRWGLTGHGAPRGLMLTISGASVLLILLATLIYFQRTDATLSDVV
jgi:lipopolysaccharide transport system permease protein